MRGSKSSRSRRSTNTWYTAAPRLSAPLSRSQLWSRSATSRSGGARRASPRSARAISISWPARSERTSRWRSTIARMSRPPCAEAAASRASSRAARSPGRHSHSMAAPPASPRSPSAATAKPLPAASVRAGSRSGAMRPAPLVVRIARGHGEQARRQRALGNRAGHLEARLASAVGEHDGRAPARGGTRAPGAARRRSPRGEPGGRPRRPSPARRRSSAGRAADALRRRGPRRGARGASRPPRPPACRRRAPRSPRGGPRVAASRSPSW